MRHTVREEIPEPVLAKEIRDMLSGLEIKEVKVNAAVLFAWQRDGGHQRQGLVLDLSNGQRVELRFEGKLPAQNRN